MARRPSGGPAGSTPTSDGDVEHNGDGSQSQSMTLTSGQPRKQETEWLPTAVALLSLFLL